MIHRCDIETFLKYSVFGHYLVFSEVRSEGVKKSFKRIVFFFVK